MPFLRRVASIVPKYIDEDGVEREVDTTVVPSIEEGYEFENTTNSLKTFFKRKIAGYEPVMIKTDKGFVTWQLFGMSYRDELGNEEWLERVREQSTAEAIDNKVVYRNSLTMIDDEFVVEPGMLKHNTIIHQLPQYSGELPGEQVFLAFEGRLDFPDTLRVFVDGEEKRENFRTSSRIELKDEEGNTVFYMPEPNAYEKEDETKQTHSYYEVVLGNDFITFLVETPYDWLKEAQYPVVVDPTLVGSHKHFEAPTAGVAFSDSHNILFARNRYALVAYKYDKSTQELTVLGSMDAPEASKGQLFCSPDASLVVTHYYSGHNRGAAYSFDLTTGEFSELPLFPSHNTVDNMALHPSGKYLVYGTSINRIDKETGELTPVGRITTGGGGSFYGICFSPDGDRIAALWSSQSSLVVFDFDSDQGRVGDYIRVANSGMSATSNRTYLRWTGNIIHYYFEDSVFSRYVVVEQAPGVFTPWYLQFPGEEGGFYYVDHLIVHPSGKYIISAGNPAVLTTVDTATKTGTRRQLNVNVAALGNGFSRDGSLVALSVIDTSTSTRHLGLFEFVEPKGLVFTNNEGRIAIEGRAIRSLDLGVVTEDIYSDIHEVRVENHKELAIEDLTIQVEGNTNGDLIEFSKTKEPFVPEPMLHFPEILEPREGVTFYIRVKPHPDNTSPLRKIPISARAVYAL